MGRSDGTIRRCWKEWVENGRFQRHVVSDRRRATTDREDRLIARLAVTAYDSSLSTIRNDLRGRVCRSPGQRADPAFTIARHTDPHPGVIVWGAIYFKNWTPLVVIRAHLQHRGTSTTFRELFC
ncbi:hypothetical protein TNCV_4225621 [Trichonephila clavipes]|uniref:Uncharacterized protein n=1 Tax=Trichonephila clavipes TaxID=2585209 RepID=A0A8X6SX12_TRICX|nr:hypothetical protein TNCV_4225621 [Trichonephila clavipes]